MAPPGMPNTTSAPTRSSAYTRACAPVARVLPCGLGSAGSWVLAGVVGTWGACGWGAWGWSPGRRGASRCGERAARSFGLGAVGPGAVAVAVAGVGAADPGLRLVICSVMACLSAIGVGGIKNPPVPFGSRGERAVAGLV